MSRLGWLMAVFLMVGSARAQWEILDSGSRADLRGIDSVGNGVAWASGTEGTVLRTTEDGKTWVRCATPAGAEALDFRGVQAFDALTAIVMSSGKGDLSRLYKTVDGCQSWKLILANPDADGFWDAIQFNRTPQYKSSPLDHKLHQVSVSDSRFYGVLTGDPVDGKFVIYETHDSGDTWWPWPNDSQARPAYAKSNEAMFAASNSGLIAPGDNIQFAFVTGGVNGSRVLVPELHGYFDGGGSTSFEEVSVPFPGGESAGAFSMAFHYEPGSHTPDLMLVGGDYKKENSDDGVVFFIHSTGMKVSKRAERPAIPPHGFRSAVAYDEASKTWITVGPNGTDVSVDDGRNWRALRPDVAAGDAADADQHWNALSLPFVVGPHGRIGRLRVGALKPSEAAPTR